MESAPTKIMCVDDCEDVVELFERALSFEPDLAPVGSAASADALLDEVSRVRPDVVLLDLTMPGTDPLEALEALSADHPNVRVIVFSGHDDPRRIDAALAAGAEGYVSKDADTDTVIDAIRRVRNGETVILAGPGHGRGLRF